MKRYDLRRMAARTAVAVTALVVVIGGGVAIAATSSKSGTGVVRISVLTQTSDSTYTSSSFTTVATSSVQASSGHHLLVRFTAESACYGGRGGSWCAARILVDGVEAAPAAGTNFAFNSSDSLHEGSGSWESLSMERIRTVTYTGSHTVKIQMASVNGATHRLDDWTLSTWVIKP